LAKLENVTLWEKVYQFLRDEILANRLIPGTVLQEGGLAASLGVSRGPVREAIGRLASEGLVVVRPRRGAVVTRLSKKEFLEAYQIREALEVLAIRLAIPNLGEDDLGLLETRLQEMERCATEDDVPGFFVANKEFHGLFVGRSGNEKLQEMHSQLIGQMGRYQMPSLALRGNLQRSIDEHKEILTAVRSESVERAATLLAEHIRVPLRALEDTDEEEFLPQPPPDSREEAQMPAASFSES
jgi:DNA-binding GntR family transcriptional regulator